MNLNSDFFKVISLIADLLTLAGVVAAIPFALLKRNSSLFAFNISLFLQYLVRIVLIFLSLIALFYLSYIPYGFLLVVLKGSFGINDYWETGHEFSYITAYIAAATFGIVIAWLWCSFLWTSSLDNAKEFINLFLPKDKLLRKQENILEIVFAKYGTLQENIDVTPLIQKMVFNNKLVVKSSNELAGDPDPNNAKYLTINYKYGGRSFQVATFEGGICSIPTPES